MLIYLAGRYSRRAELAKYAEILRTNGHVVTSRWLEETHNDMPPMRCANEDYEDVCKANCTISFTEEPRTTKGRGGRHVEFGIAKALNQICIIIGPRENVFHHLPNTIRFDTFEQFIANSLMKS